MMKVCINRDGRSIAPVATSTSSAADFKSKAMFDEISKKIEENGREFVKMINGIFCFKVKNGDKEGIWIVDVKNGNGSVKFDPAGKGEVTISLDDENMVDLMTGRLNPQQAFFQGKIKIAGNMGLAMKLHQLKVNLKANL